tara:strand:+ start:651 stop:965 length:315 start_codon:yes stop_codon:yes gene_type:complete
MNKVYVVNKSGHDFKAAERFGELVFLSQGKMDRYAITSVYREFSDVLNESDPDDYILLTGLSSMSAVACSIFAYKWERLNLLLYKNNKYIERHLILGELINKEQ